jgi:hypothetical protein
VTATCELNNFGTGDGDFAIFWPKKAKQASKISDRLSRIPIYSNIPVIADQRTPSSVNN